MGSHLHYQAVCLLAWSTDAMCYLKLCDCPGLGPGKLSSQRASLECLRTVREEWGKKGEGSLPSKLRSSLLAMNSLSLQGAVY